MSLPPPAQRVQCAQRLTPPVVAAVEKQAVKVKHDKEQKVRDAPHLFVPPLPSSSRRAPPRGEARKLKPCLPLPARDVMDREREGHLGWQGVAFKIFNDGQSFKRKRRHGHLSLLTRRLVNQE